MVPRFVYRELAVPCAIISSCPFAVLSMTTFAQGGAKGPRPAGGTPSGMVWRAALLALAVRSQEMNFWGKNPVVFNL